MTFRTLDDDSHLYFLSDRLGAMGVATSTRGVIYFDDFDSRRISYIGTLPDPGTHVTPPTEGEGKKVYTYGNPKHLHAVTDISIDQTSVGTYKYDLNGNQTCRMENSQTFLQDFNVENRISEVDQVNGNCNTPGTTLQSWAFTYDGDGTKVKQVYFDGTNTTVTLYFFGGIYEVTNPGLNQIVTKYYAIAGMTIAMDDGTDLMYFLTDHLGSVIALLDTDGEIIEGTEQRYLPFGKLRTDLGEITQTDFSYTFQRNLPGMGLYDYKARFYDPYLNQWTQADPIIADPYNSQSYNRYAYVLNNPLLYNDPTGMCEDSMMDEAGHCPKTIQVFDFTVISNAIFRRLAGKDDLEAMEEIINTAYYVYGTYDKMLPALSNYFMGVDTYGPDSLISAAVATLKNGCAGVGRDPSSCPENTKYFRDTGFHRDFQDRFDQLFHAWAYIAQASSPGNPFNSILSIDLGIFGNIIHEVGQSKISFNNGEGASWQDYVLSLSAMAIGFQISNGSITPSQLDDAVRFYFGTSGPGSLGSLQFLQAVFGGL